MGPTKGKRRGWTGAPDGRGATPPPNRAARGEPAVTVLLPGEGRATARGRGEAIPCTQSWQERAPRFGVGKLAGAVRCLAGNAPSPAGTGEGDERRTEGETRPLLNYLSEALDTHRHGLSTPERLPTG